MKLSRVAVVFTQNAASRWDRYLVVYILTFMKNAVGQLNDDADDDGGVDGWRLKIFVYFKLES